MTAKADSLFAGSIRRPHAVIRRSLKVAVRWGLIAPNPASLVDPPPIAQTEIKPYSIEEARRFLHAAEGTRLEARWVIALALGLRQGEVLGLACSDIDLDAGVIQIRRALQRQPDGRLALVETKTQRSRRTIALPPALTEVLRAHLRRQEQERLAHGEASESDLVFTTLARSPIHPRDDYRSFRSLIRHAGLRTVRLHDLRHTAATLLLSQGVPARVVMEILGHSQISVTLDTYSHVTTELSRAALDRLEEVLWTTPDTNR